MAQRLTSVSVRVGAGHNLMSVDEFAHLSVADRIAMVMQQRVEFLDEDGHPIPVLDAIDQLPKPKALAATKPAPKPR